MNFFLVKRAVDAAFVGLSAFFLARELCNLWWGRESLRWPATKGVILASRLRSRRRGGRARRWACWPEVVYLYSVGGDHYTAGRLSFAARFYPGRWSAQQALEAYPVGAEVSVLYHPRRPALATLEGGMGVGNFVILGVSTLFLIVGLSMWF